MRISAALRARLPPVCPHLRATAAPCARQGVSMSTAVSAHCARPPRQSRDVDSPSLRHWSEVPEEPPDTPRPAQLTPAIASALRDLVAWAADLAVALTE